MSQEIKNTVAELLNDAGITVLATYRGEALKALGGETTMDQWLFTIADKAGRSEQFDFFTGLGLRAPATDNTRRAAMRDFPGFSEADKKGHTAYSVRYMRAVDRMRKPQVPHIADLLHSVILDSDAVGQSFSNWCSDFGYDEDSRKAFSIYEACQKSADKLARVIPRVICDSLRETLQDY